MIATVGELSRYRVSRAAADLARARGLAAEPDIAPVFGAIHARGHVDDYLLTLVDDVEGTPCALGAVTSHRPALGWSQLTYAVGARWRGRGLGHAVAQSALHLAFDGLRVRRLVTCVRADHVASRRILARLGFHVIPGTEHAELAPLEALLYLERRQ